MAKRRSKLKPPADRGLELPPSASEVLARVLAAEQVKLAIVGAEFDETSRVLDLQATFDLAVPSETIAPDFDAWSEDPWSKDPERAAQWGRSEIVAWATAQWIVFHRKLIETDGTKLLEAVAKVMDCGLRSPQWLAKAYRARLAVYQTYETATLDRAFGAETRTERTRETRHRGLQLRGKVHAALLAALRAEPSRAIGHELYEEVGEQFGIGHTRCQELYELAVSEDGECDLVAFKRLLKF